MNSKTISPEMEDAIFRRDRFTCRECGAESPSVYLRADYINNPESFGTDEDNLATFCAECYNQRNGKMIVTPLEMMQARRSQLNQLLAWKHDNNRLSRDQVKSSRTTSTTGCSGTIR